jgi:putative flippase GtrA
MKELLGQSIRFAIVGVANTAIGLAAIYAVMFFGHAGPALANAVGYAIGLALSFVLNRSWTFKDSTPIRSVLSRYALAAASSYGLNLAVVLTAVNAFGVNPYVAQLLGICVYTSVMFFGCRWYVFIAPPTAAPKPFSRSTNDSA